MTILYFGGGKDFGDVSCQNVIMIMHLSNSCKVTCSVQRWENGRFGDVSVVTFFNYLVVYYVLDIQSIKYHLSNIVLCFIAAVLKAQRKRGKHLSF